MKRRITALILSALMIFSLVSCAGREEDFGEKDDGTTGEGAVLDTVPDFTVYDTEGNAVTLHSKLGKPVVVNFWATWCPPCKAEMPYFDTLAAEYGEDIEFMMVNLTDGQRDTAETVKTFIAESGYSFPVYLDSDRSASSVYGVTSIPMTVFISSEGQLVDYHVGMMPEETLRSALELLKGN